jgi:hypothetical protein
MPETIENINGVAKWHWYNVKKDLVEQGGLEDKEVMIDPFTVSAHSCEGRYKRNQFALTWVPDRFLLVSSKEYDPELINAFAKVVGYAPFARYREPDSKLVTTEWDKVNPDGRYQALQKEGKLELTKLLD